MASHDRVLLARMQLIAETIIEECLDLTPEPDCTTWAGSSGPFASSTPEPPVADSATGSADSAATGPAAGCAECGRDRYGLPADRSLAHWVLERMTGEHLTCLAAVLDTTITRAYTAAREALIATFSLRACHDRATTGILRYERLQYAARRAHRLGDAKLAALDAGITALRPDLSWEAYCRAVNELIRMLTDDEEQEEQVRENRRVDFWRSDAREGRLLLTGPLEPLHALHRRLEATARAIRAAHASTFGEQLPAGAQIADDRTIPQLMFDLLSATAPSTHIAITTPNNDTGADDDGAQDTGASTAERSTADPNPGLFPFLGVTGVSRPVDSCDTGSSGAGAAGAGTPAAGDPSVGDSGAGGADADGRVRRQVRVTCPSNQDWLRRQATVVITVPYLTLTGHAELPGTWSDGTPIPADLAARLAAGSEKFTRILTDPTTGAVCPEIAQSYTLPVGMRTTLNQTWAWCTAPGCTRRAETSEADHIIPFDHTAPARGGRTDFDNLHPLCKQHHQMKTERTLRLHRTTDGLICWQFAHGITHTTTPADRPIDREAARITRRLLGLTDPDDHDPPPSAPDEAPPDDPSAGPPDDADADRPDRPDDGPPHDSDDNPPGFPDGGLPRSPESDDLPGIPDGELPPDRNDDEPPDLPDGGLPRAPGDGPPGSPSTGRLLDPDCTPPGTPSARRPRVPDSPPPLTSSASRPGVPGSDPTTGAIVGPSGDPFGSPPGSGPDADDPDGNAPGSPRTSAVIDPWECWEKIPRPEPDGTEGDDPRPDSTRQHPAASVDSTTANRSKSDRLGHVDIAVDRPDDRRSTGTVNADLGSGAAVLGVPVSGEAAAGGAATGRSDTADRAAGGSAIRTPAARPLAGDADNGCAAEASTAPPADSSDPWWHADDDPPPF
ncbi:HNH endonuclease signature motif containing protein [Brevibacterium ihuae]|uniref:HNH endonuclease signature motif containing protein n=1 Tax=Brevibacterium ihuae TaxID=1631743 RepID=UPI0011AEC862|nr:HNH endonuclease signature motif containing protein [Brevibacterium ihuae]